MTSMTVTPPTTVPVEDRLTDTLGEYYRERVLAHLDDSYAGLRMRKFPEDLRVYEELLWEGRVDVVVEVGLSHGGSALWFRDRLHTLMRYGRTAYGLVVSVDVDVTKGRANLARVDPGYAATIRLVEGDVRDPAVAAAVRGHLPPGARVMVVDDSAHRYDTTTASLVHLAPLVPVGGHVVVEDGHRDIPALVPAALPGVAQGVLPAVDDWLATDPGFVRRRDLERYVVTSNPRGFLQRVR